MEPVLKETYGVIAYQEQVMRLASELAGFTLGEADELRRAMGKKDAAKMQAQRERFMQRLPASAASPRRRRRRSSSSSSSSPATASTSRTRRPTRCWRIRPAYLKANYPRHFMAALLTIESQSSDKVALYLAECRDLGVPVLPPDINAQRAGTFTVEPGGRAVRPGRRQGRRRGRHPVDPRGAREALGGRITSLFELAEHVDLRLVNKKVIECLVKAGAFDALAPAGRDGYLAWRPRLLAGLDRILDHGGRHQKDRDQGQIAAVRRRRRSRGDADRRRGAACRWPRRGPRREALAFEKEALGLYMSGHPLQRYAEAHRGRRRAAVRGSDAVRGRRARSPAW